MFRVRSKIWMQMKDFQENMTCWKRPKVEKWKLMEQSSCPIWCYKGYIKIFTWKIMTKNVSQCKWQKKCTLLTLSGWMSSSLLCINWFSLTHISYDNVQMTWLWTPLWGRPGYCKHWAFISFVHTYKLPHFEHLHIDVNSVAHIWKYMLRFIRVMPLSLLNAFWINSQSFK